MTNVAKFWVANNAYQNLSQAIISDLSGVGNTSFEPSVEEIKRVQGGAGLYCETATAITGADLDDAVMGVYHFRPEPDLPRTADSRRQGRKYLLSR